MGFHFVSGGHYPFAKDVLISAGFAATSEHYVSLPLQRKALRTRCLIISHGLSFWVKLWSEEETKLIVIHGLESSFQLPSFGLFLAQSPLAWICQKSVSIVSLSFFLWLFYAWFLFWWPLGSISPGSHLLGCQRAHIRSIKVTDFGAWRMCLNSCPATTALWLRESHLPSLCLFLHLERKLEEK